MPQAIRLPDVSPGSRAFVALPDEPSDPPTMKDITNSVHCSDHLLRAHSMSELVLSDGCSVDAKQDGKRQLKTMLQKQFFIKGN